MSPTESPNPFDEGRRKLLLAGAGMAAVTGLPFAATAAETTASRAAAHSTHHHGK